MSEGTYRDLLKEFPGGVILVGAPAHGKTFITAGRRKSDPDKIVEDHPAQPADDDDPFEGGDYVDPDAPADPLGGDLVVDVVHRDPDDGLADPDKPEPPPAPKSILDLRHG